MSYSRAIDSAPGSRERRSLAWPLMRLGTGGSAGGARAISNLGILTRDAGWIWTPCITLSCGPVARRTSRVTWEYTDHATACAMALTSFRLAFSGSTR